MSGYVPEAVQTARSDGRRRRATITLVSLLLILFFAFWYAFSYYRASVAEPSTDITASCVTISPGSIVPSTTHVNVYNSTKRNGLAGRTARELELREFIIDKVANDPKHKKITAPAEIRYGKKGTRRAQLVKAQIGKGAVMVKDKRNNAIIDLVLGTGFKSLAPAPTPSPGCTVTPSPSPSTSATASSASS